MEDCTFTPSYHNLRFYYNEHNLRFIINKTLTLGLKGVGGRGGQKGVGGRGGSRAGPGYMVYYYPVLKYPQPTFLHQCQRPRFTPIQDNGQNYGTYVHLIHY